MKIISEQDIDSTTISCNFLHKSSLISFATDTVYGVACDAEDELAVEKLYQLKNRDSKKPIAIFVKDLAQAEKIFKLNEIAKKIASKFLPGALTIVSQVKSDSNFKIAQKLYAQDGSLGFRIVGTNFITKLMNEFGGILAVSSANISGQEAAKNAKDVAKYFQNSKLDLLISGADLENNIPSTVIRTFNNEIEILRQGAISIEDMNKIIND